MALEKLLSNHSRWMKSALREAERALEQGEVPVGAVVVLRDQIVGRGHNMVERLKDPTAHAEMIAITAACETLGSKFLEGCSMYVTLEPCPMCAGSLVLARLEQLVFGAFDEKAGAAGTLYNLTGDGRLNHSLNTISGVEADRSVELLQLFFQNKRAESSK